MVMSLLVITALFKVSVSNQECTVQFINELIQLHDGYLALSNAPSM